MFSCGASALPLGASGQRSEPWLRIPEPLLEARMKSLIAFSHVLLQDMEEWCGVSAPRDHKEISSRVDHEGLSFLTITLPAFGKDFERSLDQRQVSDDLFCGFRKRGRIPEFLRCFLRLVFDECTGTLLDSPDLTAIRAIRQFTLAFGKINIKCSQERIDAAFDQYIECEKDVRLADKTSDFDALTRTASVIFADLFSEVDHLVYNIDTEEGSLLPRHGPGSTSEKLLGNKKYDQQEWTVRLDRYFPAGEFLIPSYRYWESLDAVNFLEPQDERPVRVVAVPKTLKTPRIIALEPACMQYAQQALMEQLVERIERHDLLSSFIGFRDQIPNQDMARQGSQDGTLATLDLSEASDRVSNQHVRAITKRWPHLRGAVQACRSQKADVPGHGEIRLAKFASMGSALCFPFEAMVFLTIIIGTIAAELNVPVSRGLLSQLQGRVRVYGDDIIVPVDFAPSVANALESFGLKVNSRKSFWSGNFRESCGGDFYDGMWVTPVRVREQFPATLKHVDRLSSTVALRNQLHAAGHLKSVEFLDNILVRVLPVYPVVDRGSAGLGRHSFSPPLAEYWCSERQTPLIKACVVKNTIPSDVLDGTGALMKFHLRRGDLPLAVDSFIRAGRPSSARITTKRIPVSLTGM
jgi:hypothetical protein